jgi:Flp pilus assembly protein TadG
MTFRSVGFRRTAALPRKNDGAAMVEFAIVAPLLFALIFGIIDFGRALFLANNLTSAVREGARLAAVQQDPTTAASQTAVQNAVTAYITTFGGGAPTTAPTVTLNQVAGQTYSITVTLAGYPFTTITPLGPVLGLLSGTPATPITMPTVSAVFRWEGAVN